MTDEQESVLKGVLDAHKEADPNLSNEVYRRLVEADADELNSPVITKEALRDFFKRHGIAD